MTLRCLPDAGRGNVVGSLCLQIRKDEVRIYSGSAGAGQRRRMWWREIGGRHSRQRVYERVGQLRASAVAFVGLGCRGGLAHSTTRRRRRAVVVVGDEEAKEKVGMEEDLRMQQ